MARFSDISAGGRKGRARGFGSASLFEALEGRVLLSSVTPTGVLAGGAFPSAAVPSVMVPVAPTAAVPTTAGSGPTAGAGGTVPVGAGGGVTIYEKAGVGFSAVVGSFTTLAPGTNLRASINWGDGSGAAAGTIVPAGVSGLDLLRFNVDGSHTYASVGNYSIVVTVTQNSGPPGSLALVRLVTSIHSQAIVTASTLKLDGTIRGKYLLAPTAASIGATYVFNGTGSAGVMGPVSASGQIRLPLVSPTPVASAVSTGAASGTLTLTNISASALAGGSVMLRLTGISASTNAAASGAFPTIFAYTITGGTGVFADATGSGTISVALDPTTQMFTFVIHSV